MYWLLQSFGGKHSIVSFFLVVMVENIPVGYCRLMSLLLASSVGVRHCSLSFARADKTVLSLLAIPSA
jgi:hypothetical protein